ncbi:MAG TPA: MFS transporter, partial [Chloroflexota bacterium]|nr:MFS transporter [Chloroflexota bacterium]
MFSRFARFVGLGGVPTTLGDPLYRALFPVLVAQGVIFGGQTPFTPLWAKEVLGADTVGAGVLQAWAALLAVCFGLAYGLRSDRTRRRTRWLLVAFLLGIPARLALPWVTEYWLGVALNAVATMGTFSLVFALLGDWLRYRQEQQSAQIHSTVRLAFALGWQIGAAGAGIVVARFGYGGLFLLTAALQAVTVLCVIWGVRDAPATDDSPTTDDQRNHTEK